MSKTQANVLMALMVVLIGGLAYTILLLKQPTVIANEIIWAPNSTDTKYHRFVFLRRHRHATREVPRLRLDAVARR